MQNEWLKSILGEFQGYINEVKQNAQAQGINADFLDLQEGVLNPKALVGESDVGIPAEDEVKETERFFPSNGTYPITRYYQALYYARAICGTESAYGMECNACCTMYFLQSYGLIPPNISRKTFELAFTPLNPAPDTCSQIASNIDKRNKTIKINGNVIKPKENLFDNLFNGGAVNFLKGATGANSAIYPHLGSSQTQLKAICDRFYNSNINYVFLKKHFRYSYYDLSYLGLRNKYQDLIDGIEDIYFEKHVVFIALLGESSGFNRIFPYMYHYCIIVKYKGEVKYNGHTFKQYLADDPFYGQTTVTVPSASVPIEVEDLRDYFNHFSKFIYPNAAIGV